eukprot:gene10576-12303_t
MHPSTPEQHHPLPPSPPLSPPFMRPKQIEKLKVDFPVQSDKHVYRLEGFLSHVKDTHNHNTGNPLTAPLADLGIVLTHPHPMLGGNYQNNVVLTVSSYLTNHLHVPTLCFNFRGVGASGGKGSWRGGHEREDVLAAVNYLLHEAPLARRPTRVVIVGYSYGAVIGASVADKHDAIMAYTAISYPFGPLTIMMLGSLLEHARTQKPKLFLMGDHDNFTSLSKFKNRLKDMPGVVNFKIFEGVDHFYGGHEKTLAREVSNWILDLVKIPVTNSGMDPSLKLAKMEKMELNDSNITSASTDNLPSSSGTVYTSPVMSTDIDSISNSSVSSNSTTTTTTSTTTTTTTTNKVEPESSSSSTDKPEIKNEDIITNNTDTTIIDPITTSDTPIGEDQ